MYKKYVFFPIIQVIFNISDLWPIKWMKLNWIGIFDNSYNAIFH